jgi:hypothetical protein
LTNLGSGNSFNMFVFLPILLVLCENDISFF